MNSLKDITSPTPSNIHLVMESLEKVLGLAGVLKYFNGKHKQLMDEVVSRTPAIHDENGVEISPETV
jgi:hypothetical protein